MRWQKQGKYESVGDAGILMPESSLATPRRAGGFHPFDIGTLQIWVDAQQHPAQNDNDGSSSAANLSPIYSNTYANPASPPSNGPRYRTGAVPPGDINGRPCWHQHVSGGTYLGDNVNPTEEVGGVDTATIAGVVKPTGYGVSSTYCLGVGHSNAAAASLGFAINNATSCKVRFGSNLESGMNYTGGFTWAGNSGVPHAVVCVIDRNTLPWSSNTIEVYIDGVFRASVNDIMSSQRVKATSSFPVGWFTANSAMVGMWGEVLIYEEAIAQSAVTELSAFLMNNWGI